MPMITEGPSVTPAGIARYVGAGAAIQLSSAPSDVASGGVAFPADPGDLRIVRYIDLIPTDVGVTVTYDGSVPTAGYGFDIQSGDQMKNVSPSVALAMKIFIPAGVTLHVRYGWGTK